MSVATPIAAGEPPGRPLPENPAGSMVACPGTSPDVMPILRAGSGDGRVTHMEQIPGRKGTAAAWPDWVPAELRMGFGRGGISMPWAHQAAVAEHARAGRSVIVST